MSARKLFSVQIDGEEYNAIMTSIAAIGGRAFGATSPRDGIDPIQIMTDMATEALQRLGGERVGALIERLGDACESAYGNDRMTTNGRESPLAGKIPFPKSALQ